MLPVVELSNVSKKYGPIQALEDITINFNEGETVAFLGSNGAGKSTILKIIAAQITPTEGEVKVLGYDTKKESEQVKKNVGLVGHRSFMYDELTIEENLEFYGGFIDSEREDRDNVIKLTDLSRWRNVKVGHLSYGLRKRSDIARALLGDPRLLVFDELFSGLDGDSVDNIIRHLRKYDSKTLLVSSHSEDLIKKLCEKAVYLKSGFIEKVVELR